MVYIVMACIVMAYIVMAYIVMAYIGMAYIVMAYIVMASISQLPDGDHKLRISSLCDYTGIGDGGMSVQAGIDVGVYSFVKAGAFAEPSIITTDATAVLILFEPISYGLYSYGIYTYGLYSFGPI